MATYMKPRPWKVVPATGGVTFIECKSIRFTLHNDGEDTPKQLVTLLNRKDREIARLKAHIQYLNERS